MEIIMRKKDMDTDTKITMGRRDMDITMDTEIIMRREDTTTSTEMTAKRMGMDTTRDTKIIMGSIIIIMVGLII